MVLLACMVGLPAAASTVLGLSIEALARHSDRVVLAEVISVETRRDPAGPGRHTFVTLGVERTLLGRGPDRVVVRQLGGRVGHRVSRVLGDARFRPSEEVVVFLRRDPDDPALWHLAALAESKFTVVRDGGSATAVRDLSELSVVGPDGGPAAIPRRLSLAALEAAVARARGAGSGRPAVP